MKPRNTVTDSSRRRFLQSAALGATAVIAPSFVMSPRRAYGATLDNVHIEAAKKAKELAVAPENSLRRRNPRFSKRIGRRLWHASISA